MSNVPNTVKGITTNDSVLAVLSVNGSQTEVYTSVDAITWTLQATLPFVATQIKYANNF